MGNLNYGTGTPRLSSRHTPEHRVAYVQRRIQQEDERSYLRLSMTFFQRSITHKLMQA